MKISYRTLISLFLLASIAEAQETTDPVGYTTIAVSGNGGSGQPKYTFATLGMTNFVAYQSTTTSTAGSTTLVDPNATWADNAYNGAGGAISYYVEITSGARMGTTYDITATSAASQSLTLTQALATGVASGDSYKIRPHWTIASVFGATNQNGLAGGNSSTADQILVWNPAIQGYATYYYKTSGAGGTGWRNFGAPTVDASASVIYPDDGFIIVRNQSADFTLTVAGAVKTGQTSIPAFSGYTLLGNVYAAPMTLQSSGLYTGNASTGVAPGTSTTADQILIWNPAVSGYDTYYYKNTPGLGGTGWRSTSSSFMDAATTSIPPGTAMFINRVSGSGFDWVAPQHPALNVLPAGTQAQTATDPNEGVRVTADASPGAQVLTWYGTPGRSYFVQQSCNLVDWNYVPVVRDGAGSPDSLNFASTDSRQFWRLKYTDASTNGFSGAAAADFDGDGLANQQELDAGADPFNPDTDGDGFSDGVEALAGTDPKSATDNPGAAWYDPPIILSAFLLTSPSVPYYSAGNKVLQSEYNPTDWLVTETSVMPGSFYTSSYVASGNMPSVPALPARPDADSSLNTWSTYYLSGLSQSTTLQRLVNADTTGPGFFTGATVIGHASWLNGTAAKYKLKVSFPSRNARTVKVVEQRIKQPIIYELALAGYRGNGNPVVTSSQVRTLTLPANAKETAVTILQPDEADDNFLTTAKVATVLFITPAGDPVKLPVDAGTDPTNTPDGANEFTFSNASAGVLTLNLKVHMPGIVDQSAAEQAKYTFDVDAIGNSVLTWAPGNAGGKAAVSGEYLIATAIFTGLPQNNSDFGTKTVRLNFDGYVVEDAKFEVFFMRDEKNHPGKGSGTDPNWFYYWLQTVTLLGPNPVVEYSTSGSVYNPNTNKFALSDGDRLSYNAPYGANNPLQGIDNFAWTARHESQHYKDWCDYWNVETQGITKWQAAYGQDGPSDNKDPQTTSRNGSDYLPNYIEDLNLNKIFDAGDRYDWSNGLSNLPGTPSNILDDAEDYTCKRHTTVKGNHSNDWANPGMQHKTLDKYDD
ncbi:TIGR02597 family protein [Prosthecobacter sp.]|uniref:TIGR02597 family protein n=1 Tax=Prosthecobacter sp. TaxID=1965333 RepID=UPI0037835487